MKKESRSWKTKFNQDTYIGPYVITAVRNNGTIRAHEGRVTDTFNIQKSNSLQGISCGLSLIHMAYIVVGLAKYSQ